jgi:hypothetical protein
MNVNQRAIIIATVIMGVALLGIPLAAVLLAGVASGHPLPLGAMARGVVLMVVLGGAAVVLWRSVSPARWRRIGAQLSAWSPALFPLTMGAVFLMLMVASFGLGVIFEQVYMVGVIAAMSLVGVAQKRHGTEVRCARCDYEQVGPALTPDPRHDQCPECGSLWRRFGGTVVGQRRRRLEKLCAAALVVMLGLGWTMVRGVNPALQRAELAVVPTGLLLHMVVSDRSFRDHKLEVLLERGLSPAQEEALFRGLLERHGSGMRVSLADRQWLKAAAEGGRVPLELRERYSEEPGLQ